MKILTADQIRQADAYTISHEPIKSIDLMERAASACFEWITDKFSRNFHFKIFCGVGNNGGDGLAIARMLYGAGYKVDVYLVRFSQKCSDDFLVNEKRISGFKLSVISISEENAAEFPLKINDPELVIIDAIFGTGLSRAVTGFTTDVIKKINESGNTVISIDLPSGLFCEDNHANNPATIIKASHTLTFECPKLAFLFAENEAFTGNWEIMPVGLDQNFISTISCRYYFITRQTAAAIMKPRKKFSHKGTYGHALLLCGSYGKMGAALLATKACLRSGAGLVTCHTPKCGYGIIQTSIPEAMVSVDESDHYLTTPPKLSAFSAIGVGPGIGLEKQTQGLLKQLIQNYSQPLILDADAINIVAENKTWLSFLPARSILTPHPKEFQRLAGSSDNDYQRLLNQISFAKKFNCYVVLKGAHTSIACPDGDVFFNSTGNPGMATGGSGDVLTGILAGLHAQGYSSKESCVLGVYLHGLAGDIAAEKTSYEALLASDIIENIGEAFKVLSP